MAIISKRSLLANATVLLAVAAGGNAAAVKRAGHDFITPFPENAQADLFGNLMTTFKPSLLVHSGCSPFPAVNDKGEPNNGLRTTGAINGSCGKDIAKEGQIYGRAKEVNGLVAICYAWYFPKDQLVDGSGAFGAHRHDWEGAIVWVDNGVPEAPTVVGVAASSHGGWDYRDASQVSFQNGQQPKMSYVKDFTHKIDFAIDSDGGDYQPLIGWDTLPQPSRDTLNNHSFEKAVMPCKDATLDGNLQQAAPK